MQELLLPNLPLPPDVKLAFLTRAHAIAYQQLRLKSLEHDAPAFLSLHETEVQLGLEAFARHLDTAYHPPYFGYVGLFWQQQLVAYIQIADSSFEKQRHIAFIYNVYVSPAHRHKGYAQLLFEAVFMLLKTQSPIERIYLSCTASNTTAYQFYQKMGFRSYGTQQQAVKWQGKYDDTVEMVKVL